jgi:hypothetical protein
MPGAQRDENHPVAVGCSGPEQRTIVAQHSGHDAHASVERLRLDWRHAHRPRVQPGPPLDDPPHRTGGGRAERGGAGAVDLAHVHRAVDLTPEHDHDSEAGRGAGAGQCNRVEQIRRTIGAGIPSRTVGAREHDRRLAAVQERAQDRQLFECVRPGGYDHAFAGVGGGAGPLGQAKRLGQRDLWARQREHVFGRQLGHRGQLGQRLQELIGVESGYGALPAHGDRSPSGEEPHRPDE